MLHLCKGFEYIIIYLLGIFNSPLIDFWGNDRSEVDHIAEVVI